MSSRQRIMILVSALLMIFGLMGGLFLIPAAEIIFTSGWEAFFGQVLLTRESGGMNPNRYITHARLLGEINPDEIIEGRFLYLPEVAYFWDPDYLGFPETALSKNEVIQILQVLQSGMVYKDQANGYLCYLAGSQSWKPCEAGKDLAERFRDIRFSAERTNQAYSVQIRLEGDLFLEYRLYLYESQLAFEAIQPNRDSLYGTALVENALLDLFAQRVTEKSIPILWEDFSEKRANRIASRRLGRGFDRALDLLHASPVLQETLGTVEVIRPAAGENRASFWMDSSHLQLHFYVRGERGEGVVLMRGFRCFDAELIFQGKLIELFQGAGC